MVLKSMEGFGTDVYVFLNRLDGHRDLTEVDAWDEEEHQLFGTSHAVRVFGDAIFFRIFSGIPPKKTVKSVIIGISSISSSISRGEAGAQLREFAAGRSVEPGPAGLLHHS